MANSGQEKWHRYERALLAAMGETQWPAGTWTAEYRLLILPAFHAPCCLRLALADPAGRLALKLLADHYAGLFDSIWRQDAEAEARAVRLASGAILQEMTDLEAGQAAAFHRELAALEPLTLEDVDLAARDGVSIRCECHDGNRQHAFSMRSPTAEAAPRHARLVALFLDAALEHIRHPQIHDYLVSIRRYF